MEQDTQYQQFEGLAVATASRVFHQYAEGLRARGVEIGDAVQEAKLVLWELAPRLSDPQYTHEQRTAFVVKSIRGRMRNWTAKRSRNGDKREPRPPHNGPDPADLIDMKAALATLDPDIAAMVEAKFIDGLTFKAIGKRYGLSAVQVRSRIGKATAALRRQMEA